MMFQKSNVSLLAFAVSLTFGFSSYSMDNQYDFTETGEAASEILDAVASVKSPANEVIDLNKYVRYVFFALRKDGHIQPLFSANPNVKCEIEGCEENIANTLSKLINHVSAKHGASLSTNILDNDSNEFQLGSQHYKIERDREGFSILTSRENETDDGMKYILDVFIKKSSE